MILTSLFKRFGISNVHLKKTVREETRGRKQLPLETRQAIWEFWYNNSSTSTITSRPAKNRVDSIPKSQQGLQYHDGVKKVINKRNVELFESPWMIVQETVRQLHKEFTETTEIPVSIGTFLALRPFYIRSPKMQDIEMCVCKTHLHARWAIEVLLKLTREQNIPVNFTNYKSFFQEVYSSQCVMPDGLGEYIRWECTQDKKHLCTHITERFQSLKNDLNRHHQSKYVKMLYFDKIESMSKNGKISKRLKAVSIEVNISFVLDFIEKMLPNIIHHRNLLRNYRTNINTVLTNINNLIQLWIDFSENLTVPVNKEIQSLH